MSTLNKIKKTRKPGSGRKRKIGAITSQDYAEKLKQLEKREAMCTYMTPQQKETIRKEKRSLKNRLSALRSREKKRTKLDQLEQAVKRLQQEIEGLKRENQALRQSHSSTSSTENLHQTIEFLQHENQTLRKHSGDTHDIPIRKRRRSSCTLSTKENSCSQKKTCLAPLSPSLSSNSLEAQKISTPVKPCTHNCRSAASTQRSCRPSGVTGQYSHLLWEMPWKTLRSIFSTLWIVSKILIASKTRKEFLQSTTTYRQTQRSLRQIFWKTLVLTAQVKKFVGNDTVPGTTLQQQAFTKFDQICEKLLKKAVLNKEGCIRNMKSLLRRHKRPRVIMFR